MNWLSSKSGIPGTTVFGDNLTEKPLTLNMIESSHDTRAQRLRHCTAGLVVVGTVLSLWGTWVVWHENQIQHICFAGFGLPFAFIMNALLGALGLLFTYGNRYRRTAIDELAGMKPETAEKISAFLRLPVPEVTDEIRALIVRPRSGSRLESLEEGAMNVGMKAMGVGMKVLLASFLLPFVLMLFFVLLIFLPYICILWLLFCLGESVCQSVTSLWQKKKDGESLTFKVCVGSWLGSFKDVLFKRNPIPFCRRFFRRKRQDRTTDGDNDLKTEYDRIIERKKMWIIGLSLFDFLGLHQFLLRRNELGAAQFILLFTVVGLFFNYAWSLSDILLIGSMSNDEFVKLYPRYCLGKAYREVVKKNG